MSFSPTPCDKHPGFYEIPGYRRYGANRKGEILFKDTGHVTAGGNAGRYLKVAVFRDGDSERTLQYVHDLICRAFRGKPKPGQVVLHADDDRRNNRPSNLAWGTQSSNIKATYDNGLRKPTTGPRPSKEEYRHSPFVRPCL